MPSHALFTVSALSRLRLGLLLACLLPLAACKPADKANSEQLDDAGMWTASAAELRTMNVSGAEITELSKVRAAGLSDPACVELVKLARSHHEEFSGGQPIADLLATGSSEQTVLELARMGQLGLWAGQAQALRLVGLSDNVILAVAHRSAEGLPILSGVTLGKLKNVGASDAVIVDMVQKGTTEKQASAYIAQREAAAGGHGFVYQRRRRTH